MNIKIMCTLFRLFLYFKRNDRITFVTLRIIRKRYFVTKRFRLYCETDDTCKVDVFLICSFATYNYNFV